MRLLPWVAAQPELLEDLPGQSRFAVCYGAWSALLRLPASRARLGRPYPSAWWAWSVQLLRAPAGPRQAGSPLDLCLSRSSPRAPLAPALRPWPRDPVHCPRARARRRARVGALCPTRTTSRAPIPRDRSRPKAVSRIRPNRVWRRAVAPLSGVCRRRQLHTAHLGPARRTGGRSCLAHQQVSKARPASGAPKARHTRVRLRAAHAVSLGEGESKRKSVRSCA